MVGKQSLQTKASCKVRVPGMLRIICKGLFINYVTETWEVGDLPCSHTKVLGAMRGDGGV